MTFQKNFLRSGSEEAARIPKTAHTLANEPRRSTPMCDRTRANDFTTARLLKSTLPPGFGNNPSIEARNLATTTPEWIQIWDEAGRSRGEERQAHDEKTTSPDEIRTCRVWEACRDRCGQGSAARRPRRMCVFADARNPARGQPLKKWGYVFDKQNLG